MTNILKMLWDYLKRANSIWKDKTQPIKGRSFDDKFESIQTHYSLSDNDDNRLNKVRGLDKGEKFISVKVDEINDYASHRAAFFINVLAHILLVNFSTLPLMGYIPSLWFKVVFVAVNLFMLLTALWRMRTKKNRMLTGPGEEPEWTFWGIFRGNRRKHNLHIKEKAQPYKVRMRDERLFSIMYLVNAITLLFAGQFLFTDQLPSLLQFIVNIPLFILTIPLAVANGYWAFGANNEVVKAATERGKVIDKIKI